MTIRRTTLAGAALAVIAVTAGCGSSGNGDSASPSSSATGSAPAAAAGPVGVSLPLLTSPFWTSYKDYVPAMADKLGVSTLEPVNADGKKDQQLTQIASLVSQGAKALVLSPLDSAAIKPALDAAEAKNIPVVSVDVAPDGGKTFMVVRANNRAYGQQACEFLGSKVTSGTVIQLEGDLASINGRDRTEAFAECMKTKFPALKVIGIATEWSGEKAQAGLLAAFTSNSDIKGIYSQAGGVFLAPTLTVLKSKGLLVPPTDAKHVFVVSNDGIKEELDAIRAGQLDATVSQPADSYAEWGLYYAKAALEGKTFQAGPTDHGSTIVALPSGALEDQLPAPLVTAANVDDPALWGNKK